MESCLPDVGLRLERFAEEPGSDFTACLARGAERRAWRGKRESILVKSKVHTLHLLWMGRWALVTRGLEREE